MSSDQIEALSNSLSRFGIIELVILGLIGLAVLIIVFLGKKLVDVWMQKISHDSQETLIKLNRDNTEVEAEIHTFVKDIVERLTPLEDKVLHLQKRAGEYSQDIEDIKKILSDDDVDRKERQALFDNEFGSIKTNISSIFSILSDHESFQEKLSEGTLENQLFNDTLSNFKRMKAYIRLIAMKKNGRIKEKGYDLIIQDKGTWLTVIEVLPSLNLEINDQVYFDTTLDEINHRLFDGMMW